MPSDRIRLSVAEARDHAERAMRGIGYDSVEAHIVADHAIDAALCGYEYSGLAKLLNIPEHRRFKEPRLPIRVLRETEVSALYDGGNNVGMLALYHAARATIAKAATNGFAIVGVTNSWMSGRSAYYVEMIANADFDRDPHGGLLANRRPARRQAPGARYQPDRLRPAVVSRTDCLRHGNLGVYGHRFGVSRANGQLLPEGVAIDPEGQPTRDPTLARAGALLPFGGYKGFGLAFIVQAFGLLTGSELDPDKDDGYVFVVFKPDLVADLDDFKQQLGELIERIKATPRQPEVGEIRIPGERAFRSRERALREGIEIDRLVYEALGTLHA